MARNINSLLNKKGWTGKEVGKALVASIVHDIKHQSDPDYKPLFSQSDFDKMHSSLNTERDYLTYEVYRDIYSGLVEAYNYGIAKHQQFYNGYYRYAMYLTDAQTADQVLQKAELIPYVMTEEQYNKLKEQAEKRLKSLTESFSSLLFTILSDIMETPEDAPEAIRTAIEATKKEAVTNERILSAYNKLYGRGYYQLADGTRSDQIHGEEWREKIKANYLKTHKLYIEKEIASYEETTKYFEKKKLFKSHELFFNGIDAVKKLYEEQTGEELPPEDEKRMMEALENFSDSRNLRLKISLEDGTAPLYPALNLVNGLLEGKLNSSAEWHYYTEAPADITKYDIIAESLCFYNGEESEGGEPQLKEFKADYSALYKALEAYIKELVPQARDLKPSQYDKDLISWGELAELGIEKYISLITTDETNIADILIQEDEDTTENLLKHRRILLNGIVIAKEPKPFQLNENGNYIDKTDTLLDLATINSIDDIAQNEKQRKDIFTFREHLFKPALRYLYAFNELVKIISSIYDIEEVGTIELTTATFESQLDAMNNVLYMYYTKIYGTQEEKERKRGLIKEIFSPTDYEELKPTQEAIDAVTAELDRLGFSSEASRKLKNFDNLIAELCKGAEI